MELTHFYAAIAACIGGIAMGLAYFAAVKRSADALFQHDGWRTALLLTLMRLIGAIAVLVLAAQAGAIVLVSVFVGFLIARAIAMSSVRGNA
ncbi:MAG: hypothetical protein GC190_04350 [Alphaproteobacteria bacterium]|nr:hypothetical protein [Alphaproteobacteria bacterium]